MRSAPLYRCYWCLQRASAKAPQKNIAPSTAANQAGGPLSGGLLKMLIAPTQSATPMPRQVNRMIYFHTIIAASKALQFTVAMRARSWVGSGQVALRIPLHSGYAAGGHMVQLKRSHPGINRGTFVVMGRKGPNVRFGSLADITFSSDECPPYLQRQFGLRMGSVGTNACVEAQRSRSAAPEYLPAAGNK